MPKRLVDTAIWEKPWFRKLSPVEKAAWKYLTDRCDNVGVWDGDRELADFVIGAPVDWDGFAERCNGNIAAIPNGKWWLVDFCAFQHPDLVPSSTSKPIQSYIKELKKHDLWDLENDCLKGMDTLSIGYWVRDREREREKDRKPRAKKQFVQHPRLVVPMNQTRYDNLVEEWTAPIVDGYMQRVIDYAAAHGKTYKDYASAAAGFMARDIDSGKLQRRADNTFKRPEWFRSGDSDG